MAEPMDPQMRQKLLLGAILFALVVYGGYRYLYKPQHAEVAALQERLDHLETENQAARALTENRGRSEVEGRLQEYRAELRQVEGLIPSSEELPDLLDAISAQAQRTGVELSLIQPTGAETEEYYVRRTYDLGVLGKYHQIGSFLTRVASLPRIVTPTNLNVTVHGDSVDAQGSPELEAKFSIETYVLPTGPLLTDSTNAK